MEPLAGKLAVEQPVEDKTVGSTAVGKGAVGKVGSMATAVEAVAVAKSRQVEQAEVAGSGEGRREAAKAAVGWAMAEPEEVVLVAEAKEAPGAAGAAEEAG